jgi:hypothetical protein
LKELIGGCRNTAGGLRQQAELYMQMDNCSYISFTQLVALLEATALIGILSRATVRKCFKGVAARSLGAAVRCSNRCHLR